MLALYKKVCYNKDTKTNGESRKEQNKMTIKKAIKKQLDIIQAEQPTTDEEKRTSEKMLALLENLGRDLLTVANFESVFGMEIEKRP